MNRVAALLAAAALATAVGGCGEGGGAEPGAPRGVTLMLDFQPNAVHAGIFDALADGRYEDAGARLRVRSPSASTDAPKLLASGDVDFAVLDIHDLGLARQAGIDIVGIAALVQRPLASVIARDGDRVRRPRDLEGKRTGVTGLPSDDAALESVVEADGGDPAKVKRVNIGFGAVKLLSAGRVAAATSFWNAEGLELRRRVPGIRIFKVDQFGAPPYPELILATSRKTLEADRDLVRGVAEATEAGIANAREKPESALRSLIVRNKGLDRESQRRQLQAIRPILGARLNRKALEDWADWDVQHGILRRRPVISKAFDTELLSSRADQGRPAP